MEVQVTPFGSAHGQAIVKVHLSEFQSNMAYLWLSVVCKDIKKTIVKIILNLLCPQLYHAIYPQTFLEILQCKEFTFNQVFS